MKNLWIAFALVMIVSFWNDPNFCTTRYESTGWGTCESFNGLC